MMLTPLGHRVTTRSISLFFPRPPPQQPGPQTPSLGLGLSHPTPRPAFPHPRPGSAFPGESVGGAQKESVSLSGYPMQQAIS